MILNNLHIVGNDDNRKSITIKNSLIQKICNENGIKTGEEKIINFENAIIFPGLINSHDHLEFSLFPALGNKTYKNYIDWGEDIHKVNKKQIDSILNIPVELRYQWGIYKNILSGVTTVIQHGKILNVKQKGIIDVYNGGKIFHSVELEKYWRFRINLPGFEQLVVHIAEGTDDFSKKEIKTILGWNFFKKKIVGIHAVALQKEDAKNFEAIVWCPVSNYFLYNATAEIDKFKDETKILFGTDSSASADGNIWEHLRFARNLKLINDEDLFSSLTTIPGKVWNLRSPGIIKENYLADLVVAENKTENRWDSFFSINPGDIIMILKKGEIILWDESVKKQLNLPDKKIKLSTKIILPDGKIKYVDGNLKELVNSIHKYNTDVLFPLKSESPE